jgi:hypothetical protein
MTSTRSWAEMLAGIEQRRRASTGADVAAWNERVRATGLSLVGPRRTYAVVQSAAKSRVDLRPRLTDREPGGRLLPARSIGNGDCTVRFGLTGVDEVDDEVVDLLAETWAANL